MDCSRMCLEESHRLETQLINHSDITHCDLETKSILKPAKVRAPLQEVDLGQDNHIDFDVVRKRRVSFAGVNKIKEFHSKAESVIICSTPAYEETFSTSSDSSALTASVVAYGGKETLDDCTLLNDTMDLTGTMSETEDANMMDITYVSKAQPTHQIKVKEGIPTNCENIDPNSRKMPELPKMSLDLNFIGHGSEMAINNRATLPDPVKALVKELLEDSKNDITVDMTLVGDNSVICSTLSKPQERKELNPIVDTISGSNILAEIKPLSLSREPESIFDHCSADVDSKEKDTVSAARTIKNSSFMEFTQLLPLTTDTDPVDWPSSNLISLQNSHSNMEFTEAIKNKLILPDPQLQNANDLNLENKYLFLKFDRSQAEESQMNISECQKSQMEFTEALPQVFPRHNNLNTSTSTKHGLVVNSLSSKCTLNQPPLNILDMSQSMDITEIINPQIIQPNNKGVQQSLTCSAFKQDYGGVGSQVNKPFTEVPKDINITFEQNILETSQMEITEALPNFLKNKNTFSPEKVKSKGESEVNSNKNFDFNDEVFDPCNKQHVTSNKENLCNGLSQIAEKAFDIGQDKNTQSHSRDKQNKDFIEAGKHSEEEAVLDNRDMDLTQMDFTEAIPTAVPGHIQFPLFGGYGNRKNSMTLKNTLLQGDEPMECTETIPSNVFQPLINVCPPAPIISEQKAKPSHSSDTTNNSAISRCPDNYSNEISISSKTSRQGDMEFTEALPKQPINCIFLEPSKGEKETKHIPVFNFGQSNVPKYPDSCFSSIFSPSKTSRIADMEFTEALPQHPIERFFPVPSKDKEETENISGYNVADQSSVIKYPNSSYGTSRTNKTNRIADMEFTEALPQQPLSGYVSAKGEPGIENPSVFTFGAQSDVPKHPDSYTHGISSLSKTNRMANMDFTEALPQQPLKCFFQVPSKGEEETKNTSAYNIANQSDINSSHAISCLGKNNKMADMEFTEALPQHPMSCYVSAPSKGELGTENTSVFTFGAQSDVPKYSDVCSHSLLNPSKTNMIADMEFTAALPQQPINCFNPESSNSNEDPKNISEYSIIDQSNITKCPKGSNGISSPNKTNRIADMEFTEALPQQSKNCFKGEPGPENPSVSSFTDQPDVPKHPVSCSSSIFSPSKANRVADMEFTEALPQQPIQYFSPLPSNGESTNTPEFNIVEQSEVPKYLDSSFNVICSPSKTNKIADMEFTVAVPLKPMGCFVSELSKNEVVTEDIADLSDVQKYPTSSSRAITNLGKTNITAEMEITKILPQQPNNHSVAESTANKEGTKMVPPENYADHLAVDEHLNNSSLRNFNLNKINKLSDIESQKVLSAEKFETSQSYGLDHTVPDRGRETSLPVCSKIPMAISRLSRKVVSSQLNKTGNCEEVNGVSVCQQISNLHKEDNVSVMDFTESLPSFLEKQKLAPCPNLNSSKNSDSGFDSSNQGKQSENKSPEEMSEAARSRINASIQSTSKGNCTVEVILKYDSEKGSSCLPSTSNMMELNLNKQFGVPKEELPKNLKSYPDNRNNKEFEVKNNDKSIPSFNNFYVTEILEKKGFSSVIDQNKQGCEPIIQNPSIPTLNNQNNQYSENVKYNLLSSDLRKRSKDETESSMWHQQQNQSIADDQTIFGSTLNGQGIINKKLKKDFSKVEQPVYECKGDVEWQIIKRNRLFMADIQFTFVSQKLWKHSFPWPLDVLLQIPAAEVSLATKNINIKLMPRLNKSDAIDNLADRLMKKSMNLILAEDWLNSQCSTIKDLLIAVKLIEEEYAYLHPLISSLKSLRSFFPFTIKDFRLRCKIVNLKLLRLVEIEVNVTNYKKLSGKDIIVTNHRGGIRQEEVQKLFDGMEAKEDRFVNFFRAVNHLLESS